MKLSYTLATEGAAKKFVIMISDIDNPYYAKFVNIERNTVRYRITSYIEDEDGNLTRHGPIINPNLIQT
jgi:hypothetical protein